MSMYARRRQNILLKCACFSQILQLCLRFNQFLSSHIDRSGCGGYTLTQIINRKPVETRGRKATGPVKWQPAAVFRMPECT